MEANLETNREDGLHPPPYRTFLNRDRLVYCAWSDAEHGRPLAEELTARGFEVWQLPDQQALLRQLTLRRPDLVLLPLGDAAPEVATTLEGLAAIRDRHLGIHSVLLAPEGTRAETVVDAVRHGASAVFSIPYVAVDVVAAIEQLLRADLQLVEGVNGVEEVAVLGFGALTARERQILAFVVDGRTNKEIAAALGLSYRTVEVHRRHIMAKTGARNAAELVRMAIKS